MDRKQTEHPRSGQPLGNHVAIVTGASRRAGIGAAICRALAPSGVDLLFTHWLPYDRAAAWDADEAGPAALLAELRTLGVRAETLAVDQSQPEAAEAILDATEARLGPATILVNNAAHSTSDDFRTLDAASLDAHYAVNLRGTALLSVAFARRLIARAGDGPGWGRIVNLTSGQSRAPMPAELAYAASKGAVEAFTVSLSAGLAPHGITVNAVDPGPTDTGWMSPTTRADLLRRFPFGRLGQPADAAHLVAFLCSDAGGWITGQVIHSEGGFIRQ